MFINMLLAHFVADYVLQPDALANWKSQSLYGVLTHGLIVTGVTLLFALTQPQWWLWALFIGLCHTLIDVSQFLLRKQQAFLFVKPLTVFACDQVLHFSVIGVALILSGQCIGFDCLAGHSGTLGLLILGYVLVSMPAWVTVEYLVSGIVLNRAPDFRYASKIKYPVITERVLILTFVLLGQYMLIPLVVLPRTAVVASSSVAMRRSDIQIIELMISTSIAMLIGVLLKLTLY